MPDRPVAGALETRAYPLEVEGRRLRGRIPYGIESRDLGGYRETIDAMALRGATLDDLVLTVEHAGVPLGRYPRTLDVEDRADGLHWSCELPDSRADVREAVERGDLLVQAVPDVLAPGSWRTPREAETNRLVEQLYDQCPPDERDALMAAHEDWHDRKEREHDDRLASTCVEHGLTLVAATSPDHLDELADSFERAGAHANAWGLRRAAQARRTATRPPRPVRASAGTQRSVRPRERRERHVARSTSSSDSGDDGPSPTDDALARFERVPGRSPAVGRVFRARGRAAGGAAMIDAYRTACEFAAHGYQVFPEREKIPLVGRGEIPQRQHRPGATPGVA